MNIVPAFEIAAAPNEPQAAAVALFDGINPATYPATYSNIGPLVSILYTIRPPDPGVGHAY